MEIIDNVSNIIKESSLFKECGKKDVWISGSSTEVYPISIWVHKDGSYEINIQLKTTDLRKIKPRYNKLIGDIESKYPNLIKTHWFNKNDGSCPAEICIRMEEH